jgi:protein-S-isoprenylcysteine O-methyltransferase Ste14
MLAIRIYYQSKVLRDQGKIEVKEGSISLIAGSIAALTTLVFGFEYIFFHGFFAFAYAFSYPIWLRWLGAAILAGGILLLWAAHHHLGRSFHSLVVSKEKHVLVDTGPYHWIRHPIYSAYLLNYLGGGLLTSNLVLTIVPVTTFSILVFLRMGQEEQVLIDLFGERYVEYMGRTGRLVPRFGFSQDLPDRPSEAKQLGTETISGLAREQVKGDEGDRASNA